MLTARHGIERLKDVDSMPPRSNGFTARLFTRSINWDPAFRNANHWIDRCVAALRIANNSSGLFLPWEQAHIVRNGRFLPQRGPRSCARAFIS